MQPNGKEKGMFTDKMTKKKKKKGIKSGVPHMVTRGYILGRRILGVLGGGVEEAMHAAETKNKGKKKKKKKRK